MPLFHLSADTDEELEKIIGAAKQYRANYILFRYDLFGNEERESKQLIFGFLRIIILHLLEKYETMFSPAYYPSWKYQQRIEEKNAIRFVKNIKIKNSIMLMSTLLKQIQKELEASSTTEAKAAALKFVPNAEKVYGIRTPVLNIMAKKYKEGGFDLVKELWNSGAFEERLLAAKLLNVICKKDPDAFIKTGCSFSKDISDWAVCDTVGMQSLKPVAKKIQKEIFELSAKLVKSKNLWERRLSLVIIEVFTKDKVTAT